ncbi:MAG: bifunctional hydroxymethylpyrimidine kinase/phosphomethylpyrimidine kinase [Hyphomicrobiales bacterium]
MTHADAPYVALTIAGSDSSGGAGIQADLKSFAAFGVHGASVITAVTAQNTTSVNDIHTLPLSSIEAQLDAVFSDMPVRAIKIGMIGSATIASLVGRYIKQANVDLLVVDTPLMSGTGVALGDELVRSAIVEHLFPLAHIITPNLHEAALLLDEAPLSFEDFYSADEMKRILFEKVIAGFEAQAQKLLALGPRSVLLKGGHFYDLVSNAESDVPQITERKAIDVFSEDAALEDAASEDVVSENTASKVFVSDWVDVMHHHGTGCALASAIAANLIYGKDTGKSDKWAVERARNWLQECLKDSQAMSVGKGAGPLNIANLRKIDL